MEKLFNNIKKNIENLTLNNFIKTKKDNKNILMSLVSHAEQKIAVFEKEIKELEDSIMKLKLSLPFYKLIFNSSFYQLRKEKKQKYQEKFDFINNFEERLNSTKELIIMEYAQFLKQNFENSEDYVRYTKELKRLESNDIRNEKIEKIEKVMTILDNSEIEDIKEQINKNEYSTYWTFSIDLENLEEDDLHIFKKKLKEEKNFTKECLFADLEGVRKLLEESKKEFYQKYENV